MFWLQICCKFATKHLSYTISLSVNLLYLIVNLKILWQKVWILWFWYCQLCLGEYKKDSPYIHNARLPDRIIPEVTRRDGIWNIERFPSTGELCISCNWRTLIPQGGQCHRCYFIDIEPRGV